MADGKALTEADMTTTGDTKLPADAVVKKHIAHFNNYASTTLFAMFFLSFGIGLFFALFVASDPTHNTARGTAGAIASVYFITAFFSIIGCFLLRHTVSRTARNCLAISFAVPFIVALVVTIVASKQIKGAWRELDVAGGAFGIILTVIQWVLISYNMSVGDDKIKVN